MGLVGKVVDEGAGGALFLRTRIRGARAAAGSGRDGVVPLHAGARARGRSTEQSRPKGREHDLSCPYHAEAGAPDSPSSCLVLKPRSFRNFKSINELA